MHQRVRNLAALLAVVAWIVASGCSGGSKQSVEGTSPDIAHIAAKPAQSTERARSSWRAAPACPEGQVELESGSCCWPGQSFSALKGGCVGVPQCPEPLVLVNNTCDRDSDGDGLVDTEDRCPEESGITKYRGCPDGEQSEALSNEMHKCADALKSDSYKSLVEEGVALSQGDTLTQALARFEAAQQLCTVDPLVTYGIARVHQIYGDCSTAVTMYENAAMQLKDAEAFGIFTPTIKLERIEKRRLESQTSCP